LITVILAHGYLQASEQIGPAPIRDFGLDHHGVSDGKTPTRRSERGTSGAPPSGPCRSSSMVWPARSNPGILSRL